MGDANLTGYSALAIVSNYGVEQDELIVPVQHLRDDGADIDVAAPAADTIQTLVGDRDQGKTVEPTLALDQVEPADYDLLFIPGGTLNADTLRRNETAIGIVRAFTSTGAPVAAICHGPWALVEAGATEGKTLTSYPSLQTDIRNAGGTWVDRPVVTDDAGYPLITSRRPDDLDDFVREIDAVLTAGATA
ncbi:General stress protein 18 [Actinomadura rubteroloni]|uniref:General stress protein 18 n=1 Tax=Actinomadura rubteroloni TaxID=1926885 RepID=A0A2P4UR13_9ACTN|nr:type 1 glutamine amidotransferase domain-containing protein [Actinomadura rubteroloni]POM27481.1 General stress protein 18 [Actinomadura rubteroloni]